jgi:predicted kinase
MTEITKISPTLIVLSGLPGSGKSVLAESLSRALSVPIFSIDPIETAMWRAGLAKTETGVAAYEVAQALADEHLRLRHSVIVDAVNPAEAPRAAWRNLAAKHRVSLKIIECACSDETMLRQRIESRVHSTAATHELTWARLLQRRARIRSMDRSSAGPGYVAHITRAVACASAELRASVRVLVRPTGCTAARLQVLRSGSPRVVPVVP